MLYVRLPASWLATVHGLGLAVIDRLFVLAVSDIDEHGRPVQALVLSSDDDTDFYDPDHVPSAPDQRFGTRRVSIAWDGGAPTAW